MSAPQSGSKLRARGLACVRGNRRVFAGLEFDLRCGGLLQISGPNGSGKTSLLRMVCGFLQPAEGTVEWDGEPVKPLGEDYHQRLAYLGHSNGVKEDLDAAENLVLGARVAGLPFEQGRAEAALQEFSLGRSSRTPCKFLSLGQRRRLALARFSLSGSRMLWVLDEPFAALDSAGIEVVRGLLERHLGSGGLVVFTTHHEVAIRAAAMQRIELGP